MTADLCRRRRDVEELHLETPVAVEAGALQSEGGVQPVADLELIGELAVVEEDGLDGHTVEGAEAGAPVLALGPELATFGEPHVARGKRRVLEARAERRQAFERAREVVADRLGLQIAVDPQNGFE